MIAGNTYNAVLVIAGSDSGGGAGVQADIKAIAACGAYATTAITAITAQNTRGVDAIHYVDPDMVVQQIRTILSDIPIKAIKIGMLGNNDIAEAVTSAMARVKIPIVLDPVMFATSGHALLQENAMAVVVQKLTAYATLVTPNLPEAQRMLGLKLDATNLPEASRQLADKLGTCILLKGGHNLGATITDHYYNPRAKKYRAFTQTFVRTANTHGTGCTLSSSIAAYLSRGFSMLKAIEFARNYLQHALISGAEYKLGSGNGPVDHFHDHLF